MASASTTKALLMATYNAESRLNPSNLLEIEESWDENLRERYGKVGGFKGTKSYYDKPRPTSPQILFSTGATTIAGIEYIIANQALLEDCKEVTKTNCKYKDERASMFAWMYKRISTSARDHLVRDSAAYTTGMTLSSCGS
jgi:hypothetical protein